MHDATLLRKVVGPPLPTVFVHRTHLVARLQEAIAPRPHPEGELARCKLILCCAPAGYGKTTLLAEFVRSVPVSCCWYFLDQGDTDPIVFLRTLLASIRQVFPHFGIKHDPIFRSGLPENLSSTRRMAHIALDALCTAFAAEISTTLVLILSNYEEINESEILTDLVDYLLKKLPPQVTLIIESRVVPDLSFASFVIHDAMGGLDREDLRFSAQEIAELARLQGLPPLTETEAEHLAASFDGWIAGILLGTRLGEARLRRLPQSTPRTTLSDRLLEAHHRSMLFTYVLEAVLKQQDPSTVSFLQTTSILQQIDPAVCNTLCECNSAAEHLARLERLGLFLTKYESTSGTTYICHPAIREVLREQLQRQEPERFWTLHRQAAMCWHTHQNYEQAIYHAFACHANDLALFFILEASEQLLEHGQHETITRWISALPSDIRETSPRLLLLQATLFLGRGQHASAFSVLEKAEALLATSDEPDTPLLEARMAILQSKALFQAGEYSQAEVLCQHVLPSIPLAERALRAAAEACLGMCANLQGQFISGITHLQQALQIWANQPPLNQAVEIHRALANTYYLMGNFLLAKHHLSAMMDIGEQLQDVLEKGNALIIQGLIAQDQGLASVAETTFQQALQITRTVPYGQRGEAYALVNLASLAIEQEHYTQALNYAEQGLALAQTFGNRSLVNDALMCQALSYLFLNDPTSAFLMASRMEVPGLQQETVGYERVWRDLTYGLIYLVQDCTREAVIHLQAIETALSATSLQRARFQAKLRLAACYLAQNHLEQAVHLLQEVVSLLAVHPSYLHLVRVELRWLPALLPVIRVHPQFASLYPQGELTETSRPQSQNQQGPAPSPLVQTSASSYAPGLSRLTIYAFGEPAVFLDGQPIKRWRLALVKELFFFLLNADQPLSREVILAALWPEGDEQATPAFHNTLYHFRKLFGEASVVFHSAGYALDLAACYGEQIFYDVRAFQHSQIEAEQALTLGEEQRAKEALSNMVHLYRGDYGRAFYHDWCSFRRDTLRAAYLEAHRQLAQIAWRAEAWTESAEHWREMLHVDNCLEEAHCGLMRCYMRLGERGAALRQYQTCQKVLEEELGVQPGLAIQHVYQQVVTNHRVE